MRERRYLPARLIGIYHTIKLRIPGTEDMDEDYTDYLFHVKGTVKGTVIGIIVAILSGVIILLAT